MYILASHSDELTYYPRVWLGSHALRNERADNLTGLAQTFSALLTLPRLRQDALPEFLIFLI